MGLLQRIFSAVLPSAGAQITISTAVAASDIPAYRKELLFFSDDKPQHTSSGLTIIHVDRNIDGSTNVYGHPEPSTIDRSLPISKKRISESTHKLPFYPSYARMNPDQRALYLAWLRDVTAPIETGFVFVYYYGLERHLIYGKFTAAVDEIMLLRKHHDNRSFQSYSATALVHACLLRRNANVLRHLYLDLNFDYFGNSVLLILHQQSLDLLPDMLMRLALCLSSVNKRYIKEKCPMYQQALLEELRDSFGKESYPFAANYALDKVKGVPFPIFANISFDSEVRTPPLPNLLHHKPFQTEFEQFFQRVHAKAKLLRNTKTLKSSNEELGTIYIDSAPI